MLRSAYVQGALLAPEAVDAVLRLGVVGSSDHLQVLIEVRNASDGTLLAMEALPHAPLADMASVASEWVQRLLTAVGPHVLPF